MVRFYLARLWGRIRYSWSFLLVKLLTIFVICVISAYFIDLAVFKISTTRAQPKTTQEAMQESGNTATKPNESSTANKNTSKKDKETPKKETILFSFWQIVGLYALVLFLWLGIQSRKQLVVEEFTIFPKDEKAKGDPQGLGALLAIELDRLKRLFQIVDEQRAISTATGVQRTLAATFKGEDVSSLLKEAVSPESKLKVGPLTIPANAIMALLGRIFQGPRLRGSLHQENFGDKRTRYTLAAQLVSGDKPLSWLVTKEFSATSPTNPETITSDKSKTSAEKAETPATLIYGPLVKELAYRIFTDLALPPTFVRWEATKSFSEGLKAYRDCLRTPKDRTLNLKRAEHHLTESLSIDENMDLAYHNLGVVYKELGRREAALAAFTKSLELSKGRWEPAYGLAREYYNKMIEEHDYNQTFQEVIKWCDRVRELQPDNAKVLNLKGLAYINKVIWTRRKDNGDGNPPSSTNPQQPSPDPGQPAKTLSANIQDSLACLTQAVRLSRRAFLREVGRGKFASASDRDTMRQRYDTFLTCLHNLAMVHLEAAKYKNNAKKRPKRLRNAKYYLRQADYFQSFKPVRDESLVPWLHFAHGKINLEYLKNAEVRKLEADAKDFEDKAQTSRAQAQDYGEKARSSRDQVRNFEYQAQTLRDQAQASENNAQTLLAQAQGSENNAQHYRAKFQALSGRALEPFEIASRIDSAEYLFWAYQSLVLAKPQPLRAKAHALRTKAHVLSDRPLKLFKKASRTDSAEYLFGSVKRIV